MKIQASELGSTCLKAVPYCEASEYFRFQKEQFAFFSYLGCHSSSLALGAAWICWVQ